MTFKDLGLKESILESISKLGFETPSPIQEQVIPYLLNNESLLEESQKLVKNKINCLTKASLYCKI